MKSIHKTKKVKGSRNDSPYPKLMKFNEFIVLFTERGKGVVVIADDTHELGYYSGLWSTRLFTELPKGDKVVLKV